MEIERGFISPYFVKNQESQTAELEKPRILVTDRKIGNMNEIVPLLEGLVQSKEPLLIIADDVTGEALSSLVLNRMRGVLDVCAIKSPGFGDRRRGYLEDISTPTGAHTEEVAERIKVIRAEMEQTDSEFDKEKCQ